MTGLTPEQEAQLDALYGITPAKRESALTEYVGRPLARTARSIGAGVAGLADLGQMATEPFANLAAMGLEGVGLDSAAQAVMTPYQQPASQVVRQAVDNATGGLSAPRNDLEKVVDTAGEFISSGGAFGGLSKAAPVLSALAPQTATDLYVAGTSGAGTELARQAFPDSAIAPLVGGLTGAAAGGLSASALDALSNPAQTAAKALSINPEKAAAFEKAGVQPTLGDVSDSRVVQSTQNILKETPFSSRVIDESLAKTTDDINKVLDDMGLASAKTQQGAGELAEAGLKNWQRKGGEITQALKARVDQHVAPDELIPVTKTMNFVDEVFNKPITPEAKQLVQNSSLGKEMQRIKDAAARNDGALPFDDLVLFRQNIDNEISTFGKIGTKEQGALKQLRGQLVQSLEDHFEQKGGKALQDFKRYNKFYSQYAAKNEETVQKLLDKESVSKLFQSVVSNQRVDSKSAKSVMDSLKGDELTAFRGSLIRELGNNKQNEFDTLNFARKFKGLEPESQSILMKGLAGGEQQKLKSVVDAIDATAETLSRANHSRTALELGKLGGAGIIGAGLVTQSPATLATVPLVLGGARIAASQLFTNKNFINWLSTAVRTTKPEAFATQLNKLSTVAAASPEIAQNIKAYVKAIKNPESLQEQAPAPELTPDLEQQLDQLYGLQPAAEKPAASEQQSSNATAPYFQRLAQVESGGNPNAQAATSSASGQYQFTNSTWKQMVDKYGKDYGITYADKNDPQKQDIMAHFLGQEGAQKLIMNYGSNKKAAVLFPAAAKANRSIFFDGKRPRSVEEVYQLLNQKITRAA